MAVDKATRERWAREDRGRLTPGARLDQIVAEMAMLSQAAAAQIGFQSGNHAESSPPPGAFAGDECEADETRALITRLADVLEIELARVRGGGVPREVRSESGREAQNRRILEVWKGKDPKWIAYVEQVPERVVIELRKYGRERHEVEAA